MRPAVSPPFAMVNATEDSSWSVPLVITMTRSRAVSVMGSSSRQLCWPRRLTDLLHLRPEHTTQTIDIIGWDGEDSQIYSATFFKLSVDFQADTAILCRPDLVPFAIFGGSEGRSANVRGLEPGRVRRYRAADVAPSSKKSASGLRAGQIPSRNRNVVPRRFLGGDSCFETIGSHFQLSKISQADRMAGPSARRRGVSPEGTRARRSRG